MKFAAATAIASIIPDDQIRAGHIIPEAFNLVVAQTVAAAVMRLQKEHSVTEKCKHYDHPGSKFQKPFVLALKRLEAGISWAQS